MKKKCHKATHNPDCQCNDVDIEKHTVPSVNVYNNCCDVCGQRYEWGTCPDCKDLINIENGGML